MNCTDIYWKKANVLLVIIKKPQTKLQLQAMIKIYWMTEFPMLLYSIYSYKGNVCFVYLLEINKLFKKYNFVKFY